MNDPVSLAVSVLALAVSATTAWLTLFRRGTVRMTQPTVIYFGPDKPRMGDQATPQKVHLRTLLFATSRRGRVVESMHVSLARAETIQTFNVWVHGGRSDGSGELVRGSGLFVGETGIATDHHFLPPPDEHFRFSTGHYRLTVYAKILGDKAPLVLSNQQLEVTAALAAQLERPGAGLYFDWGPESSRYLPHINVRPLQLPEAVANAIALHASVRNPGRATDDT